MHFVAINSLHSHYNGIIYLFEADLDLYVYNPDGSELGRSTGTSRQEQVARRVSQVGNYRAVVRSYAGTGPYFLDISAGLGQPDQAPVVSIVQPSEGETVSGTVIVSVQAIDDQGISRVEVAVGSSGYTDITPTFDGTYYRYTWDSTSVPNGTYSINARATDTAGQQSSTVRSVRVDNQSGLPHQHEITRTGRVTGSAPNQNLYMTVHEVGYVDVALGWGTTADLDFYVYAPDGTYVGRAYTRSNPEQLRIDTARWGTGTYRIRVALFRGGDTDYSLGAIGYRRVTFTGTVQPGSADPVHSQDVQYTGRGRAVLSWPGASDLDFFVYAPGGAQRARGYTLNNPEVADFPFDHSGTWRVRINLYSGAGVGYTLWFYVPDAVLE